MLIDELIQKNERKTAAAEEKAAAVTLQKNQAKTALALLGADLRAAEKGAEACRTRLIEKLCDSLSNFGETSNQEVDELFREMERHERMARLLPAVKVELDQRATLAHNQLMAANVRLELISSIRDYMRIRDELLSASELPDGLQQRIDGLRLLSRRVDSGIRTDLGGSNEFGRDLAELIWQLQQKFPGMLV